MHTKEKQYKHEIKQMDWDEVRAQFNLSPQYVHLGASQFIASHPKIVRQAMARHRRALDRNPVLYTLEHENACMQDARLAAAKYLALDEPNNIALTDSTTMGLGTIYTGLNLKRGQEILTTEHDHYSQHESIRMLCARTGATTRKIKLYEDLEKVTEAEMVKAVTEGISEKTRLVGLTWVHSSTGLKIPIAKIAKAISKINKDRDDQKKVLLLVDGVHGFGIEKETFPELGCDFFIAGCHKWLYGPRGTGIIAANHEAWQTVSPVIPSFTETMDTIIEHHQHPDYMDGKQMTPGGFHTLEARWALLEAFLFMEGLGRERVCDRVHQLNRQLKEGLASMPHVTLKTPLESNLSSGITSFEIWGLTTEQTVKRNLEKKVIATKAPYETPYARFTPGIYNTPQEIDQSLEVVESLKL